MINKIDYKKTLDEIQKIVHKELKADGFLKKGRTHNKVLDNGIIQVINFQMGQYQFENVVEIPGLRTNFYGEFTINLAVFVPELYEKIYNQKPKVFIQEYNCEIRTRVNHNMGGIETWFPLTPDFQKTAELIIDKLKSDGNKWFERFDDRRKIVTELTQSKEILFSPRDKLLGAILELDFNQNSGECIFNEYYNSIEDKTHHKNYVSELAKKLKIELKKTCA